MQLTNETIQYQHKAARFCLTDTDEPLQGVVPERMEQYRQLVQSAFIDTLESAFPIAHSVLPTDKWNLLVYSFMKEHKAKSHQIWKLPFELLEYTLQGNWSGKLTLPSLHDLLLFEWLEIDIYTMPDVPLPACTNFGNWETSAIVVTPESVVQHLKYPVHKVAVSEANKQIGNYYVLFFRQANTGDVKFFDLSPFLAFVVEQLQEKPRSLPELIGILQETFSINDIEQVKHQLTRFLNSLQKSGFVLGFVPSKADFS